MGMSYEEMDKISKTLPQPFTNEDLTKALMRADHTLTIFKNVQPRVAIFLGARVKMKQLYVNSYDRPRKFSYDPADSVRPPSTLAKEPELRAKYEKAPSPPSANGTITISIPSNAIHLTIEVEGQVYEIKRIRL